jgi:hypothetical protein
LRDWWHQHEAWTNACLDAHGVPRNVNWLAVLMRTKAVIRG